MGLIIGLVFVGVFAAIALPLMAAATTPCCSRCSTKTCKPSGNINAGANSTNAGKKPSWSEPLTKWPNGAEPSPTKP